MGKFIEEKNIIETYINNFISNTTSFSKFIEGSPTFVTYYSKDVLASTSDITLGGTTEIIGVESPIKYNKIENFPLFNLDEFDPNIEVDEENGIDTELQSTAIILPNTIKPLPDDFFLIKSVNKDFLFRVNNVENSNINNNVFYKISFHITTDNIDILEEKQLTQNYKVLYENIGKHAKSIVLDKDFSLLESLEDLYDNIKNFYIKYYYNKYCNTFFYRNKLYDNSLINFINKHELFIKKHSYMENIKATCFNNDIDYNFIINEHTIFYALENKSIKQLSNIHYIEIPLNKSDSLISLYKNKFNINEIYYTMNNKDKSLPIFTNTNTEQNINDTLLIKIINDYLNDRLDIEQIIKNLNNYKFSISLSQYILIPCILFILKKIQENILNR